MQGVDKLHVSQIEVIIHLHKPVCSKLTNWFRIIFARNCYRFVNCEVCGAMEFTETFCHDVIFVGKSESL